MLLHQRSNGKERGCGRAAHPPWIGRPGFGNLRGMARPTNVPRRLLLSLLAAAPLALSGCGGPKDAVADEESARRAYLGLDRAVDRAIDLGFAGFSAASNANIPEQAGKGDLSGAMIINGQVDQGASDNKGMRLQMVLQDDYADVVVEDEFEVVYNGGPVTFEMNFKGLPDADITGILEGTFTMTGELAGDITLDLDITGKTMENAAGDIVRVPGTIHVVGSATSAYGVFAVDVML